MPRKKKVTSTPVVRKTRKTAVFSDAPEVRLISSAPEEVPVIEIPEAFLNEPVEIPKDQSEVKIEAEIPKSNIPEKDDWEAYEEGGEDAVNIGDYVLWESGGVLQFREPKLIKDIQTGPDGRRFAILEGASTGVPVEELLKSEKPEVELRSELSWEESPALEEAPEKIYEQPEPIVEVAALEFRDVASPEQTAKIEAADSWDELYVALREMKELEEAPHGGFEGAKYSAERLEQLIRAFRGELRPKNEYQKSADGLGISERYIPKAGGLRKKVIELFIRGVTNDSASSQKEEKSKPQGASAALSKKVGQIFRNPDEPPKGNSLFQKVWGIFRRAKKDQNQKLVDEVDRIFKSKK